MDPTDILYPNLEDKGSLASLRLNISQMGVKVKQLEFIKS